MEKTNFKKWGWWALGGVVAVVIITIVVASMGPETDLTDTTVPEDDETAISENNPSDNTNTDKPKVDEGKDAEELPQSGPVEDGMLVLLLAGVFAYIVSLGLNRVIRAARTEE